MTAKEQLCHIGRLDTEITCLLEQLEEIETRLTHITPILSDMPAYHAGGDKFGDGVSKMVELKIAINKAIDKYYDYKVSTLAEINLIPNTAYRIILTERYFNHKTFEQIATAINYSYYRTVRMHGVALQEFSKVREGRE